MYAILDPTGERLGLVATEKIPKGTRIISEAPIMRISADDLDARAVMRDVYIQTKALDEETRKHFLSMYNKFPCETDTEKYMGIFLTHAKLFGSTDSKKGFFFDGPRAGHACIGNAHRCWNEGIGRQTVHALRDIAPGEEITVSFLQKMQSREERKQTLKKLFQITCSCQVCISEEKNRRMDEIVAMDKVLGSFTSEDLTSIPWRVLRLLDQQVDLYYGLPPYGSYFAHAIHDAIKVLLHHGDLARGFVLLQRLVYVLRTGSGHDSPDVQKFETLLKTPSKMLQYQVGPATQWKTSVEDIPRGIPGHEFEEWLWRRKPALRLGRLADFQNRLSFPRIRDLPRSNNVNIDTFYYGEKFDPATSEARVQWCLLAEIAAIIEKPRPWLDIIDGDKRRIKLILVPDRDGAKADTSLYRVGHTVTLFYAHLSDSNLDDCRHLHIRDPSAPLEALPMSLSELMELNAEVLKYAADYNGERICHACDTKKAGLLRCSRCAAVWYCGPTCQQGRWDYHKKSCQIFRERALRKYWITNWDSFDRPFGLISGYGVTPPHHEPGSSPEQEKSAAQEAAPAAEPDSAGGDGQAADT